MSRRELLALLQTKEPKIGYIAQTGESFRVNPMKSFLTPEQRFDVLLEDNPGLSGESIDILTSIFWKGKVR